MIMIMIMIMCPATPDSATTNGEMNSSKLAQYEINLSFCGLVGMLDLSRIKAALWQTQPQR